MLSLPPALSAKASSSLLRLGTLSPASASRVTRLQLHSTDSHQDVTSSWETGKYSHNNVFLWKLNRRSLINHQTTSLTLSLHPKQNLDRKSANIKHSTAFPALIEFKVQESRKWRPRRRTFQPHPDTRGRSSWRPIARGTARTTRKPATVRINYDSLEGSLH